MILRGVTLFPYYDLGELWNISNKNDIALGRGGNHFFPEKEKEMKYAVGRYYNSCLLFHFDKMLIQNESMKLDA